MAIAGAKVRIAREERGHATFAGTTGYVMADAVKFQRLSTSTDLSVVLQQTPESYTYDADGNLTSDGLWQYFWDGENRLIRMESSLAVPETKRKRLIFAYDYMGRRIKKAVCGWSTSLGAYGPESSSYRYVYDGWNLVAELNRSRCIRTCTWGPDLSGSLTGAGGIGGLVFVRDWNSSNVGSVYPAYDGNGNLTALVRAEDGTLAAGYEYSPYGELLTSSGDYARENPFRFSTKYTDSETGLAYFGYRYYNPETGRWLNRDPIEEDGGRNLYGYVGNEPVNVIDPDGLAPHDNYYGLPEEFWDWYHRKYKEDGVPNITRKEALELYKEWNRLGRPRGDNKGKWRRGAKIVVVGTGVGVGGYIAYRIVRFLPSLLPPLWPTIPANALCP